jgi:phosphate transport system permease protein
MQAAPSAHVNVVMPSQRQAEETVVTPGSLPARFRVPASVRRIDRLMHALIVLGGIAVIAVVFGMLVFILLEVAPLFRRARLESLGSVQVPAGAALWLDGTERRLGWHDAEAGGLRLRGSDGDEQLLPLPAGLQGRHLVANPDGSGWVALLDAGQPALLTPRQPVGGSGGVEVEYLPALPEALERVHQLVFAEFGERRLMAVLGDGPQGRRLQALVLRQRRSLMGGDAPLVEAVGDLTEQLEGSLPVQVVALAEGLAVRVADGRVLFLQVSHQGWQLSQVWRPFADGELAGIEFLTGGVSLICHDRAGRVRIYSLFAPVDGRPREFGLTRELQPLSGPLLACAASPVGRSFVVADAEGLALCQATTATVRQRLPLAGGVASLLLDVYGECLGVVTGDGGVRLFRIDDPHPEAGLRAFLGKLWYEGFDRPAHVWQSTSGSDDFEPKLSLIPLIIGSFKGTLYAMIFAVPVALLAALYTAQFARPRLRGAVKPVMEIMASLPSVVLGFVAALWLAPFLETRVPSALLVLVALPLASLLAAVVWRVLPNGRGRRRLEGWEPLALAPLLLLAGWGAWQLGPVLERACCGVVLPDGSRVADFRLWWPQVTGLAFDQRNGLVVGFMMGFAVIPVVFTLAEDALANVPRDLVAAAEALGASRWQVARTIVLPVASAGLFSALMIGFGRAVGETMIVVMATGNTPVMDAAGGLFFGEGSFPLAAHWNPFDGMRTLSANLAVELPEAPPGSTHYRTLFLGALALFLMTFVLNTAAELLRQRLRARYKTGS